MSWRIEQANPFTLLRELPDGLFQTCFLRVPAELPAPRVLQVLREVHRVTRRDGTLWLARVTHRVAAEEAGWYRPGGRVHPRLLALECMTVTLLAKQPDFHFAARVLPFDRPRGSCGQRRREGRVRRRAWCVPSTARREVPPRVIDWCIQASTSPRACQVCGAPWRRLSGPASVDRNWRPGCEHGNGRGRCLVLDPFCGTGLTGLVALMAGRSFLGNEHDPALAALAQRRLATASWAALR